jgi:HTH-type transcriptional regulator / antitoxin HipB
MRASKQAIRIQTAEDLGKAIRNSRKLGGLTLAETAGLTNVGVRFLSELENGKPTVRLDKLLQVLSALGLQLHLGSPVASGRGE